jgi:hypothetical protein
MRRRQIFSGLNARDNRAPVPSGAGMGAATVTTESLSPVSREEEEAAAVIWEPSADDRITLEGSKIWTPTTDVTAAVQVKRKPGWPKGKKRK